MKSQIFTSLKALVVFTAVTGIVYPLVMMLLGRTFFPSQAAGSLLEKNGKMVGSLFIAQKEERPQFFWPRPSAADYATVPSGASNFSPDSKAFLEAVEKRRASLGGEPPADLLMASGSGLDPEISPAGAAFQLNRVVSARKASPSDVLKIRKLVEESTEARSFGIIGQSRVNVLKLNLKLQEVFVDD